MMAVILLAKHAFMILQKLYREQDNTLAMRMVIKWTTKEHFHCNAQYQVTK
jgi:hypothetical protein